MGYSGMIIPGDTSLEAPVIPANPQPVLPLTGALSVDASFLAGNADGDTAPVASALTSERDRYRAALQRILGMGRGAHVEIARDALNG